MDQAKDHGRVKMGAPCPPVTLGEYFIMGVTPSRGLKALQAEGVDDVWPEQCLEVLTGLS